MKKFYRRVLLCILTLLLIVIAAGALLYCYNNFSMQMTLLGERELYVEFGEEFRDPGAQAYFLGKYPQTKSEPIQAECVGNVDTQSVGSYWLRYIAYKGLWSVRAYRLVHVVDTQPPQITLKKNPDHYTLPNEAYREEGVSAWDARDGDVTHLITAEESDGKVIYKVTDSAGNQATAVRQIKYHDPVGPEIKLRGKRVVRVYAGTVWNDPGCIASDNCDGDLTDQIEVSGDVDMYVPGVYNLTYTVTDSYGNSASVSRKVRVRPISDQPMIRPTGKVIYLTFDDGPTSLTGELLDVLAKYSVKATFFLVNTGYAEEMKRIAKEGHTLAVHTLTHSYGYIYSSEKNYFEDLYAMQDVIEAKTGQRPMLLRFPGGSSNTISRYYNRGIMSRLTQAVTEQGFSYFDWNVDSYDAGGAKTSEEVFQNVIKGVQKQDYSVVLQHDTTAFSVGAVEKIIIWGLTNGYTFQTLSAESPECHHPVRN